MVLMAKLLFIFNALYEKLAEGVKVWYSNNCKYIDMYIDM